MPYPSAFSDAHQRSAIIFIEFGRGAFENCGNRNVGKSVEPQRAATRPDRWQQPSRHMADEKE
jgi:hypothetical protein